jgi:LysR family hydrogen peroxide-inducible transcriptional activator
MELRQLRYFVAIAQAGSFSRAAERCLVSQPSLSQQIQNLERQLGQRLFERLGRRILLTEAGRTLLERATAILAAVDDTEKLLRESNLQEGGHLLVGAIPTIAPYLLPAAIQRFLRRFPRVEVSVQEDVTAHLVEAVAAAELDLAVVALPIADERLQTEALFSEPLFLSLSRRHPLARKRRLELRDLNDEPFIILHEMHCLGAQVLSFCRAGGCQPRIACRSAQIATIQTLIAAGQGISILPDMARRADRDRRRLYRRLAGGLARTVAVIRHPHRYLCPAAERFLATLRELAADHVADADP